jgi:hypothetical protein
MPMELPSIDHRVRATLCVHINECGTSFIPFYTKNILMLGTTMAVQ